MKLLVKERTFDYIMASNLLGYSLVMLAGMTTDQLAIMLAGAFWWLGFMAFAIPFLDVKPTETPEKVGTE